MPLEKIDYLYLREYAEKTNQINKYGEISVQCFNKHCQIPHKEKPLKYIAKSNRTPKFFHATCIRKPKWRAMQGIEKNSKAKPKRQRRRKR